MTQEDFELKYDIKTNFLVYGSVKMKIKDFLSDKEMPIYAELNPQNSLINMIISQDKKVFPICTNIFMVDHQIYSTISVRNGTPKHH